MFGGLLGVGGTSVSGGDFIDVLGVEGIGVSGRDFIDVLDVVKFLCVV